MIDDFGSSQPARKPKPAPLEQPEAPAEATAAKLSTEATPAEIQADHKTNEAIAVPDKPAAKEKQSPKPKPWHQPFKRLKAKWQTLSKKKKIIAIIVAVLIVAGAGAAVFAIAGSHSPKVNSKRSTTAKVVAPKPVAITSTLTGLPVADATVNQRPVTGVMIENSDAARPQSGLDQAGVVFEAIAEAGITRFLALYQDSQPAYLGPVRSVRPYYLQWALGFDAPIAHVGGSPDGLADIQTWNVRNLDQFYNSSGYERISSRDAPHNVYTSASQLNTLEASKGFTSSNFTGFPRKADGPSKTPSTLSIDINPSSADFASHYDYDATTNSYKRSEAGAPHMEVDASGNQTQIEPKVVIAMVIPQSQGALDSSGAYYTDYAAIGSGQAYIFQDGITVVGTWTKSSNTSQISFTTTGGQVIKLNAGQTWLTAVGSASDVSYQ